jgi:hypothetical protein
MLTFKKLSESKVFRSYQAIHAQANLFLIYRDRGMYENKKNWRSQMKYFLIKQGYMGSF